MVAIMPEQNVPVQIVGSSKFGVYNKINARKTYNMFESDGWLVPYAGWKKVLTLISESTSDISGRGLFWSIRGRIGVAVINSGVWHLDTVVGARFIGNIATFSGPVFMDENLNSQIAIVDQLNIYIYNRATNALIKQESFTNGGTVPDDLTPNYVCFHDNYFLVGNGNFTGNGSRFYAFRYTDADTISVATGGQLALQTKPDYAKAIVRLSEKGENVLVFGTAVTEIQSNSPIVQDGNILLYQRNPTVNIDYGVLSVATIAFSDNFVVWLGSNEKSPPVIMLFNGSQAKTISTDGINALLQRLEHPEDSFGFIYKQDGHVFYQLTFNKDNVSLLLDFNNEAFYNVSDYNLNYHPARQVVYSGSKCYFVSINDGSVYEISTTYTTYDDNTRRPGHPLYDEAQNHVIPRQVIGDTFRMAGTKPFVIDNFYLTMEQGEDKAWTQYTRDDSGEGIITEDDIAMVSEDDQQLVTDNGAINTLSYQPKVSFSFSPDGGTTYSNEVETVINFVGYRQNIAQLGVRLGRMNEFTPKLKFWGKSRFVVGNAQMQVRQ
jgi:hypothetical protein